MKVRASRFVFYVTALFASFVIAFATGCASGGYKLTRQYAGWVNSQNLILRIILYIFTAVVFAVTLLIDTVIFNTIDFWEGRVSAGSYNFTEGEKTFVVKHELVPNTSRKKSTVEVFNGEKKLIQTMVLSENASGEIEFFIDGTLRTRVSNVSELPIATLYDVKGVMIGTHAILPTTLLAQVKR